MLRKSVLLKKRKQCKKKDRFEGSRMKSIWTGSSDFKKIIDSDSFYVDKTLLIKELDEIKAEVFLFPRPRRFGKTLNLSMLKYFYEKSLGSTHYLFESTAIWKEEKYRKEQGQWPVISITFKDVKANTWDAAYKKIVEIISKEFERHKDILSHEGIDQLNHKKFQAIIDQSAGETAYGSSFQWLTELLNKVYGKNVIVLIDEYDAPIHAAYVHGFYKNMLNFMQPFLSGVLKDNTCLERGILTGILRVAKESIFSGLNNLAVFTMLQKQFDDKFGFTQDEVDSALKEYQLTKHRDVIKKWYNGYQSGNHTIYNPWSIVHCLKAQGAIENYWLNTSDNVLIKQEVASCGQEIFIILESLLEGITRYDENGELEKKTIDDGITMTDLHMQDSKGMKRKEHAVLHLLFYAGYLTYIPNENKDPDNLVIEHKYVLKIPNLEIRKLYKDLITETVNVGPENDMPGLLMALKTGNACKFDVLLQKFVLNNMSYHDLYLDECERNLHMFILGILVFFENDYMVRSNREAGYGRYDIMLMPRNQDNAGWIIEFKKVDTDLKEKIEDIVEVALKQIKEKEYTVDLRDRGVKKIIAVGVAVERKRLMVKHEVLS